MKNKKSKKKLIIARFYSGEWTCKSCGFKKWNKKKN